MFDLQPQQKSENRIGLALLFLLTVAGVIAINAWVCMLLFGYVHTFLPAVPAFGYLQTFGIMVLLRYLLPSRGKVEMKKRRR